MGLSGFYVITRDAIRGSNGTEIIFKGLRTNTQEIKSTEGIDLCWVEEAQAVSAESWDVLIPTIRKPKSEIWLTFNPLDASDPTFQRFVKDAPKDAMVRKVNYDENPYFPEVLRHEMEWLKERDYDSYLHIWEGEVRKHSNAVIFAGRYRVEDFETPKDARFYHGADWGFAQDPTALVRCFIKDRTLYIDREAWGVGVDLDETPALFDSIETARTWPIKADNARPETISFMRRRGYRISGAKKWAGSIEDGIEFLKSFDIVVHPRCRHTIDEFAHYSYKVDRQTGDVLPVIVDAWNHCLVDDTMIACADGDKPIKDVRVGDYVYTRDGLKKVIWSGKTRENARVFSICADGAEITGTANHKVFTLNRGWVTIGGIRKGDLLLCMQKQLKHTGKHGTDIRHPADALTESISSAGKCGCTDTHGSVSAAQSLTEWLSTTKTVTAKTTTSKTLSACLQGNMQSVIRWMRNSWNARKSILSGFVLPRPHGIEVQKDMSGTSSMQRPIVGTYITASQDNANNAEKHLSQKPRIMSFAQMPAKAHGVEKPALITWNGSARFVDQALMSANTQKLSAVPKRVQCVSDGGIAKAVYDLTVEGTHEFFANGVLVHNCIDALRYSLDGMIKGRGQMVISPEALMG